MLLGYCSNIVLKYSHFKTIDTKMLCHSYMPKGLLTHQRHGEGIMLVETAKC